MARRAYKDEHRTQMGNHTTPANQWTDRKSNPALDTNDTTAESEQPFVTQVTARVRVRNKNNYKETLETAPFNVCINYNLRTHNMPINRDCHLLSIRKYGNGFKLGGMRFLIA
jgi:hypothetical protein